VFAIVVIIAFAQDKSYAGGFPTRPGRLILSPSVTYFFSNKEWDSTGVKKSFPKNGKFTSVNYSLYAEYGISRRFAVVGTVPYIANNYTAAGKSYPSSGLTDLEVGVKYYLANIDYIYYFSLQGTGITPLYNSKSLLGYHENGAELKLSFAGSGTLFNRNYYFNIDNGVRQYFGNEGPLQYRYTGTFGLALDQRFKNQLSVSVGGFYSVSDNKQFVVQNPTIARDFNFSQVSLTYGHAFSQGLTVLLTGGQFITGRNTGDGTSVSVSFAFRID
jgi:hypothetical protein